MKHCFHLAIMLYERYTFLSMRLILSRVVQLYYEMLIEIWRKMDLHLPFHDQCRYKLTEWNGARIACTIYLYLLCFKSTFLLISEEVRGIER